MLNDSSIEPISIDAQPTGMLFISLFRLQINFRWKVIEKKCHTSDDVNTHEIFWRRIATELIYQKVK